MGGNATRRAVITRSTVEPGTRLAELSGGGEVLVNSRHHQAIETVAPGLAVSGTSPDGLAEAVEGEGGPWLVAVQWHPENLAAGRRSGLPPALCRFRAGRERRRRAPLTEFSERPRVLEPDSRTPGSKECRR